MIDSMCIVLFSFQLGNPALASALPNTLLGFFEKTEEIRETYEVSPGTRLVVVNVNGDIDLEKWDNDHMEVHVVKKTNRDRDELAKVRIEIVTGAVMEIRTEYLERDVHVSVNYRIKIPRGVTVQELSTSNGDIELKGTKGDTDLTTSNGDIDAQDIEGTIRVRSSNGDLDIKGTTAIREAKTSNGEIRAEVHSLPGTGADITTSNGSIDIYIDGALDADLSAATSLGKVSVSDLALESRSTAKAGLSSSLKAKIGAGGARLVITTSNGNINIYGLE